MVPRILILVLLVGLTTSCQPARTPMEDQLFGVTLGCHVAALEKAYPGLYVSKLAGGEVLHEAGSQRDLEVFTFAEEPWSTSRITYIAVRKESDVNVLRDSTGQLPDLGIESATPRGLRLGDPRARVIEIYGTPSQERSGILTYHTAPRSGADTKNVRLMVGLAGDHVVSIALSGDIPGVRKPD